MAEGLGATIIQAGSTVLREVRLQLLDCCTAKVIVASWRSACHQALQEADDVPASMLGTQELKDLVQTMVDTMRAAPGVGLAAPQIGIPLKVQTVLPLLTTEVSLLLFACSTLCSHPQAHTRRPGRQPPGLAEN
jgi:hypothetical protein